MTAQRFTLDGSLELESQLQHLCEQVRREVLGLVPARKLKAIVLGGGYGRGHGGVLKTPRGDAPYNDLEFYVFLRGNPVLNDLRYRNLLCNLGERLSPAAGLHVEFKVDSLEKLSVSPVTIFSYDLLSGHKVIHGGHEVFAGCEYHLDPSGIVPTEPTRLLLNRCSGLLLVKELLLGRGLTPEQCDFIGRNLAKAQLAFGDALLAAEQRYHWDCRERARRLRQLRADRAWVFGERVVENHTYGVQFKLHPSQVVKSIAEFAREHAELTDLALKVWLWIENRRLNTNFSNLEEYALSPVEKCPGNNLWRNWLLNLRVFGARAGLDRNAPRYPRERLLNSLPLLLASGQPASDAWRHLQRQLHAPAADWPSLVAAYKHVWNSYG